MLFVWVTMADLALIDVKETAKAAQAFADYVALGPDRSFAKLAAIKGKNGSYIGQLEIWSSKHHWQDRLKDLAQQQLAEAVDLRSSLYVGILREYYRRFGDDPAMMQSVQLDALHGVFDRVKPADALHIIGDLTTAIRLIGVDPGDI
jgi:hypothetical protein